MSDHYSDRDVQREVTELEQKSATAARLFDIRFMIGGLFLIYGVIVTIAGITVSDANLAKAEGVNINLWTGLGMLALGIFFVVWLLLRPLAPPVPPSASAPASEEGEPQPPS
jgi:xanthine/uracil/vitamin C permease (AzgA family)